MVLLVNEVIGIAPGIGADDDSDYVPIEICWK